MNSSSSDDRVDGTEHTSAPDGPHDGGFRNILNFRDVGATINTYTSSKLVREGLLFRSARPDGACMADRALLKSHYNIRTVMDLRSKTEHHNASKKRAADARTPALLAGNDALAEPVQIPGITYREVKITGGGFEKHLLSQLSRWSYLKLILLYVVGLRNEAISVLGREVMQPRGLLGLGCDTLDASGADIADGLSSLLEPDGLPTLIHCTQGKDRTGLMVTLVLLIMGVPVVAVEYDYELSDEKLVEEQEDRMKEIRDMGLGDDFGRTAPGFVKGIVDHLDGNYGGLDKYLDGIGFGEEQRAKLRERLAF